MSRLFLAIPVRLYNALLEKLSLFEWSFDISELSKFDYFIKSRVFVATSQNPTIQELYERLETVLGLEPSDISPHATLMRVKKSLTPILFILFSKQLLLPLSVSSNPKWSSIKPFSAVMVRYTKFCMSGH